MKKARHDLGKARSAGHQAFSGSLPVRRGPTNRTTAGVTSGPAEPGACKRPQRPPLGPIKLPDRRLRTARTRVGRLPLPRPGVRVPSKTSRSGVRSSRGRATSGSARTCAIQPSRGVRDCMAKIKHQTAYWTVKGPDGLLLNHRGANSKQKNPARTPISPAAPTLPSRHKKTGLGQARDRRTLREFQFHE